MEIRGLIQRAKRLTRKPTAAGSQAGYLLPIVVVISLAIATVGIAAMRGVADNSVTLNNQYHNALARDAARAGTATAASCIRQNTAAWSNAKKLLPNTDCAGTVVAAKLPYVAKNDAWRSSFTVQSLENVGANHKVVTSIGTVEFYKGGVVVPELTKTATVRTYAQTTEVASFKPATALTTGMVHACAIASDQAYCWGNNGQGRLGNGLTTNSPDPVAVRATPGNVLNGKTITKISAGNDHTCAIASGKAYCWGNNNRGQLGTRSTTSSSVPVPVDTGAYVAGTPDKCGWMIGTVCVMGYVPGIPAKPASSLYNKTIVDIQASAAYTCALTSEGLVSCWGLNDNGQLGNFSRTSADYPVAVWRSGTSPLNGKLVKKLGTMSNSTHTCVITTENIPVCWGSNYGGQLGNDATAASHSDTQIIAGCTYDPPPLTTSYDQTTTAAVYRGGATAGPTNWFGMSGARPASGLQGKGVIDIKTEGSTVDLYGSGGGSAYTTALGDDGKVYAWGGSSTGGVITCDSTCYMSPYYPCSTYATRLYSTVSRPYGPLYNREANKCFKRIMNAASSCVNPTGLDFQTVTGIGGSVSGGVFCGVRDASPQVYCEGPSVRSARYEGYLGDGTPVGGSASTSAPTTLRAVKSNGWLSGKTVTDIQSSNANPNDTASGTNLSPNVYSCVLASQMIGCWGDNSAGQLGDGTTTSRSEPTPVKTTGVLSGGGTSIPVFKNPISF